MKQTYLNLSVLSILAMIVMALSPIIVAAAPDAGGGAGGGTTTEESSISTGTTDACGTQDGVDIGSNAEGECAEKTAFSFGDCKKSGVTISCLIAELMQFLTVLVGIAVVAGITVGGITYSTGSGNPARTQKGVNIILNSILGLLLFLFMFAIINFLIPGGVFK